MRCCFRHCFRRLAPDMKQNAMIRIWAALVGHLLDRCRQGKGFRTVSVCAGPSSMQLAGSTITKSWCLPASCDRPCGFVFVYRIVLLLRRMSAAYFLFQVHRKICRRWRQLLRCHRYRQRWQWLGCFRQRRRSPLFPYEAIATSTE